jgi:signal transduction histidine kinase
VNDQLIQNPETVLSSGPWSESDINGEVRSLCAHTLKVDGKLVIQIKIITKKQRYQQTIFQQARIYSLKFDQLLREREHKEILLHTIIHDLAGPLTSIHGVLELMERGRTSSKLTSMALEQCQVQKRMIGTILETFVSLAPNNPLPMSGSEAPDIILSAEQTFANLLENSLRYSSAGSTTELRVVLTDDRVVVSVLDEGTGISPDVMLELFERYTSNGDNAGNIGLGLYFCKIVIERWGGNLKCENRTDMTGSLFQFELPLFYPLTG